MLRIYEEESMMPETKRRIIEEFIMLDKNSKIGLIDLNIGLEAILSKYCSK